MKYKCWFSIKQSEKLSSLPNPQENILVLSFMGQWKFDKINNSKYPHKILFLKESKIAGIDKEPKQHSLTFLDFHARPQGGRGGWSELWAALRGHICFGSVGLSFLVILRSVAGHISYVTLEWKCLYYPKWMPAQVQLPCTFSILPSPVYTTSLLPCNCLMDGSLPGRRKHYMASSGLRQRKKPRKEDPILLQAGYGFSFASSGETVASSLNWMWKREP